MRTTEVTMELRVSFLFLSALAGACGDDTPGTMPTPTTDGGPRPDRGDLSMPWTVTTVDEGNVGVHSRVVALPNGRAGVAYISSRSRTGEQCTEIGMTAPNKTFWDLFYASDVSGSWATETVAPILALSEPNGIDLDVENGQPVIAALTGEPVMIVMAGYCGASDISLFRKSGSAWTPTTLVTMSGEAACNDPMLCTAASSYGDVVGHWPGLAIADDGRIAVSYRDVHSGSIQSDDLRRAELEVVMAGTGGTRAVTVDIGRGAGNWTDTEFAPDGSIITVYYNPMESSTAMNRTQGIWAARSTDDGMTWSLVHLYQNPTTMGPDMVIADDGTVYIAFYDPNDRLGQLLELDDLSMFETRAAWRDSSFGDGRYDEGNDPSIAIDPTGLLVIAYYRCARAGGTPGMCDAGEDAAVLAYRERGGDSYTYEVIDRGESVGPCGTYPSLAIGEGREVLVSYLCQAPIMGSMREDRLKVARRIGL